MLNIVDNSEFPDYIGNHFTPYLTLQCMYYKYSNEK